MKFTRDVLNQFVLRPQLQNLIFFVAFSRGFKPWNIMVCYSLPNVTDKDMTYDYKIKLFTTKTFKNYPIISRKFTASVS